jgi:hypothetical protein
MGVKLEAVGPELSGEVAKSEGGRLRKDAPEAFH